VIDTHECRSRSLAVGGGAVVDEDGAVVDVDSGVVVEERFGAQSL
jgi:hypothetical protein